MELSRYFPEFELIVYNNASDLPENIRNQMIHQGATPERVKAWVDDDQTLNKVYLIAGNTPPSEVAATLGHEIIGHRGLRAVFGEQFNDLLDLVYRDHAAEIDSYAERYLRNPENNVDNQRYLTEEFLADCANLSEKPSWWKEFIAKIRAWLRQFKPGLQFTNRDIEGAISLAYRGVRRGGMFDSAVVKDNLTTENGVDSAENAHTTPTATDKENLDVDGVRFALDRKPANVEDFLSMTGHARPDRLNFDNTGEMFEAFKKYILESNITTPDGYKLKANEGHFFSFCCGKKNGKSKGFIERAANAEEALRMVKNSEITPEEMSGFEVDRIRNIQTYVDVLTDPDFSFSENNKIIYGKKYDDIGKGNGYTAVVLNLTGNEISPVHSGFETFNKSRLENKNIKWYADLESDTSLDDARTTESVTSRGQLSDRLNSKITPNSEKVKSDNEKNLRFSVSEDGTDFNGKERKVTDNSNFKRWFADSKVVDDNGEPLVVYHGTNWDILEEPAGEAAFSDKYRGVGSGDNGFFGRGFYFTFGNGKASEGEAGYYGKNVFKFYLSIQNPFYFSETLLGWNGKRVLGDEVHSVEIVNAVNLFPELLKDFTLDTYDKNGDFSGVITLDKYARMFKKVYDEKKFSVRQTSNPDEIVVECDPVTRTQDGHTWTEYKFSQRIYKPRGETDMQLLFTHLYLSNNGFPDGRNFKVEIPYGLFREFYGEPEFRSWLENNGYDGVMQSKHGDEVVAFKPTQIKSATDNVGTFDSSNPDIRFLLAEFTPEERRDITLILKPYVGFALNHTDLDYVQYLADRGVDVSEKDAHAFAVTAMRENIDEANQRNAEKRKAAAAAARERRDQWIYANTPLYREAVEFAGTKDFKIKPSGKFRGEDFSGSFIAPEFVKYSRSKKKDDSKLDSAAGVNSNEFAAALARKWGRDELQLEQEIIDYFRDLKKTDLFRDYSDFRKNQILEDKEADRLAYEEALKIQQSRVEEEVIHILEHGLLITEEYVLQFCLEVIY